MSNILWSRPGQVFWALFLLGAEEVSFCVDPAPTTIRSDQAGLLLNQWVSEGLAAGHDGDFYDNRDGGHSRLDLSKFPRLQALGYGPADLKSGANFGPAKQIYPGVVFGNASLSGPAVSGVSIPRLYFGSPDGVRFLTSQYLGNQLYVYPEHQDHDPVSGQEKGWGDLYPLNSPCLLISQGSSYSDQPFLDAIAMTMASFKPEVKKELREQKLLFPVIQYILRSSLKTVTRPEDYLTGAAHPTVFRAEWIDEEKMMRSAQAMTRDTLPPLLLLEVAEESAPPRPGVDFFEEAGRESESLSDQGVMIARVFRGMARERFLRVRVARSFDWKGRFLKVEWKLLRGDPGKVRIEPSVLGTEADITVSYQGEALPVAVTPEITSRRIDIGVFATNGQTYSPPVFISFYFLPNERRLYEESTGRILEVDYGVEGGFVDVLLSSRKPWRDVYHYDKESGAPMGWRREASGIPSSEFDVEGKLLTPDGPRPVRYEVDPSGAELRAVLGVGETN